MKIFLSISFFFFITISRSYAQAEVQKKTVYDPYISDLIKKAKAEMESKDYTAANKTFRKALETKKVFPIELSYFFSETLYIIHQYQNSLNFVDKYIDLAGQGGNYYKKALALRELLILEFEKIKDCNYCNLSGYRYIVCDNCKGIGKTTEVCYNCKARGNTICAKCLGEGVYITINLFEEKKYESCDVCEGRGYSKCNICKGNKTLTGNCSVCLGTRKKITSTLCKHTEE